MKKSIKSKIGISLIVLVITIIVVIILAAAIIISLQNNNPMIEANRARINSDVANMQAIFTNTVGKIMAEKQEVIEIVANKLNEPISAGKSVVGEAVYKIGGEVAGRIIFDNKEKSGGNYYTGKKLPVYNKDTTWYVDEDGILRLQVGEETYGEGTGEEKLNDSIKISTNVETSSDYTKATIGVIIEYEGEIDSVTINGEIVEVVKNEEGKYVGSKEVNENGNYNIVATAKDGSKNKEIIKVEDLADNMEIWNKTDMEKFRDKVNNGATFEGKKVSVMADIDLEGSENNQFTPINSFSGTFEGNNHKINNLYIDSNLYANLGLFCTTESSASIQNTILEDVYINSNYSTTNEYVCTGGIVGLSEGKISNCGINSGTISSTNNSVSNGNWYYVSIGGIAGVSSVISNCYNKANISGTRQKLVFNSVYAGGIVGSSDGGIRISNCYNTGTISGNGGHIAVGGIIGQHSGSSELHNSYNIGIVNGSGSSEAFVAGIIGRVGNKSSAYNNNIVNSYNLKTVGISHIFFNGRDYQRSSSLNVDEDLLKTYASKLGNEFKSDDKNINNGYPILNWQ